VFAERQRRFRSALDDHGLQLAIVCDEDSVYYLTGYYDYLHMEFGRPTILLLSQTGPAVLITPSIDAQSAEKLAHVDDIVAWNDGDNDEWRARLPDAVRGLEKVGIESERMPPLVRRYVESLLDPSSIYDVFPLLADMRMIKSASELQLARHAGLVATSMMDAATDRIADGVAEYEVALAAAAAGTRKAAELLDAYYDDSEMSPNTHFLQIMASGDTITRTHHRATTRIMKSGEPVFLCFCGMTNFHRFKLGFDRTFWIDEIADLRQAELYEVAVASQQAALEKLKPGVTAESVHAAYAEVIQAAGFDYPFRCGRATGFSFLEQPQLVTGDQTVLQAGMVMAVDGSVCLDPGIDTAGFRAQVGDSFILTDDGYECVTEYSKSLDDIVLRG